MQISVNGKPRTLETKMTLSGLVEELDLNPRHVAIEVNRELVPRAEHAKHEIQSGDELEIVTLAGGG